MPLIFKAPVLVNDCLPYSTVPKSICWRGSRLPGYTASSLMMTSDLSFSEDNIARLLIRTKGDIKQIACLNPSRNKPTTSDQTGREQAGSVAETFRWGTKCQEGGDKGQFAPKPSGIVTGGDDSKVGKKKTTTNYFWLFIFSINLHVYDI